ncbi:MAG: GNAT family N-acetyltransferase [Candidatus Eisenbacteria bacterium]
MAEVVIGPATAGDRGEILRLLEGQFAEHRIPFDETVAGGAVDGAFADAGRGLFLIARDAGEGVGFAYLARNWTLEHGGPCAWLEEMYVLPERRSEGVGKRLLEAVLGAAREAGCRAVDLEVDEEHARAERLYERRGFRRVVRNRWTIPLL